MSWINAQAGLSDEQIKQIMAVAAEKVSLLPMSVQRDRRQVAEAINQILTQVIQQLGITTPPPQQWRVLQARLMAQAGGLGFLDPLLPPASHDFTDIEVNGDGTVWGRTHSGETFQMLNIHPTQEEVWRVVDTLLTPVGKSLTEAVPTVDARLPRDPEIGFGGARVKAVHPIIATGDGYPVISLRLYEPRPVPPEQIVAWGVFPEQVIQMLTEAVHSRLRVMVIGGTSTGKTTLLSALCHGIPRDQRVVTIEDPQEIWLAHPNVVTLEARTAPPGSDVPPYTIADGVDDALRMAPTYIVVGEVRRGHEANSLFRAFMTDHAGLTTFHAENPADAVFRLALLMFSDTDIRFAASKGLFAKGIDLVVQVGWHEGSRRGVGVWEVNEALKGGEVTFRQLWSVDKPEELLMPDRKRIAGQTAVEVQT